MAGKKEKTIDTKKLSEEEVFDATMAALEKQFGKGIVMTSGTQIPGIERVSSGSLSLDLALGGGIPRGRIVEIYGPESCIAGQSFVPHEVWSQDGLSRINHKGGTIARLYERFHNTRTKGTSNQGCHLQVKDPKFYVKSVNDEGSIVRNEVLDVVKTGVKPCYQINTEYGQKLIATAEHKFLTPDGYKPLSEIEEGDTVFVHNNTRRKGRKHYANRPEVYVKYHPCLPTKIVHDKKTGNDYLYYRGQKSRMAYEAFLNEMSLHHYINVLNQLSKEKIDKLQFLPSHIHVHHRDEDFLNNDINNLALVDPSEHGRLHASDRHAQLSFTMVPAKVVWKSHAAQHETYDLKCAFPYNNYIAEGIVVHNSGKTTLALHAIAEFQKLGHRCAFIDAEHAIDMKYAKNLGVDAERLVLSQPDSGEQALQVTDFLSSSGTVGLIVVDSVAALIPRQEIEKEIGDSTVGRQAQLMSQAMRKLAGVCSKSNTTIIFINQIRMKIGVMFGNPETTSGGNALKFYASVRLDIRRIGTVAAGDSKTGIKTRVKVVKNKVAPPFKQTEFNIMFGTGIDTAGDILTLCVDRNIIEQSGAWYSYNGNKLGQGTVKAAVAIEEQGLVEELRKKVLG